MAIKFITKNIASEFKKLFETQNDFFKKYGESQTAKLVTELKDNTPIDTGLARKSWSYSKKEKSFLITNDTEYIQYLNEGSSKQAPAFFIESIALKYGKPVGSIVEVKDK